MSKLSILPIDIPSSQYTHQNERPVLHSFLFNRQTLQHQSALSFLLCSWSVEALTIENKWISGLDSDSLMDDGPRDNAMGCTISSRRK